jgi:DNA repair exonuclease SbcCD ATPase subunit
MIRIKNLTVRNFMSVGNTTQAVDFDRKDLTLVLGENLDLGGDDSGARNGTGKTTIINALSYALYGQALTNIKKDNLINKTNAKNMLATLTFERNGTEYKIERGRKPNVMKFYVGGSATNEDDHGQGDSRETQVDIEKVLNMSHDMFKNLVALNTYTEPFLSLSANDQRTIIEQLLGITMLSEKADALKEQNRQTKERITEEEFRIKAVQDANTRIQNQIDSLIRRQTLWTKKHSDDVAKLQRNFDDLQHIDITVELAAHKALTAFNQKQKDISDVTAAVRRIELDVAREEKAAARLLKEIASLENHTCHACGQELHDNNQTEVLVTKQTEYNEINQQIVDARSQMQELNLALTEMGTAGPAPKTHYDHEADALNHKSSLDNLQQLIDQKMAEHDPYQDQIEEMQTQALETIDYEAMNTLTKLREHEDFLIKLLTSKDSFIRKRIIDQNLSYLNNRLAHYLDAIGLPHQVQFKNDLTVEITELGRDLDFDNLSRGERNRLILSLSWSFRDVWESLYDQINLLFIDEVVDSGMDSSGVDNALAILKKMSRDRNKSVWLVSHKDELSSRVHNVLTVTKSNGFTEYATCTTIT